MILGIGCLLLFGSINIIGRAYTVDIPPNENDENKTTDTNKNEEKQTID